MPRKPRIHYPGAVYHAILRGNAGDPIFFEDRDLYRLYPKEFFVAAGLTVAGSRWGPASLEGPGRIALQPSSFIL